MRTLLVIAVLLLAGCAADPTPPTVTTASPSPPPPSPSPSPPPSSPSLPPPSSNVWRETNGSWTLEVQPGAFVAHYGAGIPFVAVLRHDGVKPEATYSVSAWIRPNAWEETPEGARLESFLDVGSPGNLSVVVHEPGAQRAVTFRGPPVTVTGVVRTAPFAQGEGVSDDPPGLSARVDGRGVTVTYAAPGNATTTADTFVRAIDPLKLVDAGGGAPIRLVAFLQKSSSDAVADLPEPERPRVVATIHDVPAGTIEIHVFSQLACFCFPQPEATLETLDVRVG